MSIQSLLNKSARITLLIESLRKKFKIKIYIKKEKKIKRIIATTTNNIINQIYKTNTKTTLSIYKNIRAIRRRFDLVIFRIKIKNNKKILNKNNFWTKKILSNANLRKTNFEIIIYKIKIESIFKNIEKNNAKMSIKINNCIYSKATINKIK